MRFDTIVDRCVLTLCAVLSLGLFLISIMPARAQERFTVTIPERTVSGEVSGESITYLPNLPDGGSGGCVSQTEAQVPGARLETKPRPITAAQCTLSKARTRMNVLVDLDGGS